MSGEWSLGKEGGRASHDAHISKSRYGAPGPHLTIEIWGTRHPAPGAALGRMLILCA
jgi:hypothetical protein